MENVRVSFKDITKFCVDIFFNVGVPEKDADIVAQNLISANLRGVDSHGVMRVPYYARAIKKRLINPKPNVKILKETETIAIIDGDNGLGQLAGMTAADIVVEKAKATGIGLVGVKNTNHICMLANYVMRIVNEGLIGFACTNAPPAMAPWGGREKTLGTNPFCIGFPVDKKTHIILDIATSVVSGGKIAIYAREGKNIPEGWALDKDGRPTTDPKKVFALLPFGEYKGYGLALSIDILSGILLDDKISKKIRAGWETQGGFLLAAINIKTFRPYEDYQRDILRYIDLIKSTPTAEGFNEVLLPGEIEAREHAMRLSEGIPIDMETWNALKDIADELGVPMPVRIG